MTDDNSSTAISSRLVNVSITARVTASFTILNVLVLSLGNWKDDAFWLQETQLYYARNSGVEKYKTISWNLHKCHMSLMYTM